MRNKLQYAYSILVFLGVLITSYFMMDQESVARIPLRVYQGPYLRTDTVVLDPAVSQLLEMEKVLKRAKGGREEFRSPEGAVEVFTEPFPTSQ